MTADQFKIIWTSTGDELCPIEENELRNLNLKDDTINFLIKVGLPTDAAPFLSFSGNTNNHHNCINKLTTQYKFLAPEFEKYVVIGSCGNGDPIVINTSANDEIEWLNHDNNFSSRFFNSSIYAFACCLLVYRDFIQTIQKENGEDAFIDSNFTMKQFQYLMEKLTSIDSRISSPGFWQTQLSIDLAKRTDTYSAG